MTNFSPSQYVCFKLNKAMRRVSRTYETHLNPLGITPVQFYVLSSLFESDEIKFKVLAGKLGMEGPTLTGILDRLARLNFIERRDDPEDRRSLLIFLTEQAKEHHAAFVDLVNTLDNELQDQFDKKEFAVFLKILENIGNP
ncbi:MAG: MarR family transcriptional regulator [Negativicutes bacterium]|nr:MarR family transcriptional regulator [Negativicutes bacterium]